MAPLLLILIMGLGMLSFFKSFLPASKDGPMYLIVGLGNPGNKYEKNRHNVGFMALDTIADDYGFSDFRGKFQGQYSEGRIGGQKVGLLKPETYMNESGRSVGAAANFFKIDPDKIFVFHDELDLEPGKTRVRKGGGNAGHNGLKSIQAHLGTPDYWRIRIGIGHPGDKSRVSGYVLSDFAKVDELWLEKLLPALSKHTGLLLEGNDGDFMSKVAMDAK